MRDAAAAHAMLTSRPGPTALGYSLSCLLVLAAAAAAYAFDLVEPERPGSFLFFVAVVASVWYFGPGPGWLSVVLSVLAVDYLFIHPAFQFELGAKDIGWLITFAASAIITAGISSKHQRLERMLAEGQNDLESRIRSRTLDLQHTHARLLAESAERARAEATLRDARSELAHVARTMAVAELAASIAHEVNQPLAAVLANSEAAVNWLERSPPALYKATESMNAAIAAAEQASLVVTRIRNLMTKGEVIATAIDINELIRGALALVSPVVAEHEISVVIRLEPGLPALNGGRIELQHLFLNLVNNAIEAMAASPDGPRELVIETQHNDDSTISMTVADSGPGLRGADPAKLFRAFYSTKRDGMGMGLSICQTIVRSHGGTISMQEQARGTMVIVRLPRSPP